MGVVDGEGYMEQRGTRAEAEGASWRRVRGASRLRVPSVVVLIVGVLLGLVVGRQLPAGGASSRIPPRELKLMTEAWRVVEQHYVDRGALKPRRLAYGSIAGMVAALGDTGHSTFLTPELQKLEENLISGRFEGIGAELRMRDGHAVVVAPLDGSPAQRAGLRPGDIILRVDDQDAAGHQLPELVEHIKGRAGTTVTLRVLTPASGRTRDLQLTRAAIALKNVTWQRVPGTQLAHLRIAAFSQGVAGKLGVALTQIQAAGLRGVVLDLRDDPGGILLEAVGAISQLLHHGNAVLVRDARGHTVAVPVLKGGVRFELPLVVLINRGSASAAEIMAGALRDAGRARLVGETTFGTGTVLQAFPLSDGSRLLLAVQEWLTPKGHVIWHKGIKPDVTVALGAEASPLLPEAERGMSQTALKKSEDAQLLRAITVLGEQVPATGEVRAREATVP